MATEISTPVTQKPSMNPFLRALLGLLMLLPACGFCSVNALGLTVDTLRTSFQSNAFDEDTAEFVGMENFERLLDNRNFGAAVEFTSKLIFVRLLVAAVIPLLLSIGVSTWETVPPRRAIALYPAVGVLCARPGGICVAADALDVGPGIHRDDSPAGRSPDNVDRLMRRRFARLFRHPPPECG